MMVRKRKSAEDKGQMLKGKEVEPEVLHSSQRVEGSVEKTNLQPSKQANIKKLYFRTKKPKYQMAAVRRSVRINNIVDNAQNQDIELVSEELVLGESQEEDEQVNVEKQLPSSTTDKKSMEEKIDYISRLLEAQGKNIEEIMSKDPKKDSARKSPNMGYKGLYIKSQKKVGALTKENHELLLKLENALAKLEGYEKGTRVSAEWMQSLRDLTLMSNATRTTEQAIGNALSSQGKGRKARKNKVKGN